MRFTLLAVAAGAAIGVLAGRRSRPVAGRPLRLWTLLAGGLVLQVLVGRVDVAAPTLLVASYGLLLAFAAANVATVGMWMVATGIAANLVAIALNAGMPVRPEALVAAGLADPGRADEVRLAAKHHLERPSDRLPWLGDVIPLPALGEVVSFGDVVMAVGTANVVARLLAPAPRRLHSARRRSATQVARTGR